MELNIPQYVIELQNKIKEFGYESYIVGGAIRDFLLGTTVNDYDLTTNCDFNILLEIFKDYMIVNNNGEKHNTITIHINNDNVEITSFKHDINEENTLYNDLKHRDLTINSLAYFDGIIDFDGGLDDLKNKLIRANNPSERIKEDPLRLLRYLRFSSKLDFTIDEETSRCIHEYKDLLKNVAIERIKVELEGILVGKGCYRILRDYYDVVFVVIPELNETYDFNQKNPYHKNTLYMHMINVCNNVNISDEKMLKITRFAALLHDIGKLKVMTIDEKGIGHFYGHPEVSLKNGITYIKKIKVF